jgi:hypothetical protein
LSIVLSAFPLKVPESELEARHVPYAKETLDGLRAAHGSTIYRADAKYKDARIVSFLWDCTRATPEHAKFKEGVLKIDGINGCVVVSAPSTIVV